MKNKVNAYSSIFDNYSNILEKCDQFEALLTLPTSEPLISAFFKYKEDIIDLMEGSFELEDYLLFPAIIESHKDRIITESVLGLQKEHGEISEALCTLYLLINKIPLDSPISTSVVSILSKNLIKLLRKHIKNEKTFFASINI
jgi:hemerythrin-like domain-containing protein